MFRKRLAGFAAGSLGALVGLLLWGLVLGAQTYRPEAGLWTLRFQRVLACGLDYNGPPYAEQRTLWLSCGESASWRLWPPSRTE